MLGAGDVVSEVGLHVFEGEGLRHYYDFNDRGYLLSLFMLEEPIIPQHENPEESIPYREKEHTIP